MLSKIATLAALVAAATAQNFCTQVAETHPTMSWSKCAAGGSCSTVQGSVVVDSNWRWLHQTSGTTNCYTGNKWDSSTCGTSVDGATCSSKCCLDGAVYDSTYGATTSGNALNLKFVQQNSSGKNIGSRLYLMESDTKYQGFTLLGQEFTFDVDVSNLGCGLNGALYFVSMDLDGGMAAFPSNKAGAKYGTGYCDSQCPRDLKFIDGAANNKGWQPSSNDANAGIGDKGACCAEMDIWEANNIASAYTPHPCTTSGYKSCTGDSCGGTYSSDRYGGECDPDGCDFNSYRQGDKTFYGPGSGFKVDTTKPVTVVTQFLTGSDGKLSDIKRFYVQGGKTIGNSESLIPGIPGNSVTTDFCTKQKSVFGDNQSFFNKGGLAQMGDALSRPMVLVMSVWDDHHSNMLWLDSVAYPVDKDPSTPGISRGSCATTSGVPADLESQVPNSSVKYSNIKFGPIGSTFGGGGTVSSSSQGSGPTSTLRTSTRSSAPPTSSSPAPGNCAQKWGQCGGNGWTGPTCCQSGSTCQAVSPPWYSQCL